MEYSKFEFDNITSFTETIFYESVRKISWEKSKRRVIVILALYTIFVIANSIILIKDGYDILILFALCIFAIIWILVIGYYIDIFTFKIRRKYRKQVKSGQTVIYKYNFDNNCIKATWQTGTSTVFYDQISAMYYTKNTVILATDHNPQINECFVVDKSGFSSKSYNDFISFLKGKVNAI